MCPTEHFDVQNVNHTARLTWTETTDTTNVHVSSRRRCLDKYKHFVTRKCGGEHGWIPERKNISCPFAIDEQRILTKCPPNYITFPGVLNNIKICFHITSQRPWTNACLSSGSSLTLSELNLTDRISIDQQLSTYSPIWLPARQMWFRKSISSLQSSIRMNNETIQWTLAGIHGFQVRLSNIEWEYPNGCLMTQLLPTNEIVRVLTNCNSNHHMICLYNQREPTMLGM